MNIEYDTINIDDYNGLEQTMFNNNIEKYTDPESAMNAAKKQNWNSIVCVQNDFGDVWFIVGKMKFPFEWYKDKEQCILETPKREFRSY